jgi:hypothetical protein
VTTPFRDTNYETQQSPLYYWAAGLLLRLAPHRSPLEELYLLRFVNAALAFSVGLLIWKVVRPAPLAWVPVALLALIPGFGIAMCRVANDALCTVLISVALAGALAVGSGMRLATAGSLAAGIAPWAKLYGLAVLPITAVREALRRGTRIGTRLLRLLLVLCPQVVLTVCSLKLLGHPFPVMYNVRHAPLVPLLSVPWLQDAWAVAKSHIWMSGMSFLVFPTWIYVVPVLLFGWGLFLSLSRIAESDRKDLAILVGSVAVFVIALAYHDWRAFSFYGGPGGTGGWYFWAVALPEMLLLTYGARKKGMIRKWILPVLAVFALLTVLADVALFLDSTGLLVRTSRNHIAGVMSASPSRIVSAYLASRPRPVAIAAAISAVSSWLLAALLLVTATRLGHTTYQTTHGGRD